MDKQSYYSGTGGSENYFGEITNRSWDNFVDAKPKDFSPKMQTAVPERFHHTCRNHPNSISCRDPQIQVGKDQKYLPWLENMARWFYGYPGSTTIGDADPALEHRIKNKIGYSTGNWHENFRDWGWDTLQYKEQQGGRYDGQTQYHGENSGYEDWYHERPTRDLAHTWVRFNRGDKEYSKKIQDFLLWRWVTNQEADWPAVDYGVGNKTDANNSAWPFGKPPIENDVALLRNASLKNKLVYIIEQLLDR